MENSVNNSTANSDYSYKTNYFKELKNQILQNQKKRAETRLKEISDERTEQKRSKEMEEKARLLFKYLGKISESL